MPAVLETTNPLNVAAYERAGWKVHTISDELQPAMRIWVMLHDCGQPSQPKPESEHEPAPEGAPEPE